jgi:phosphoribosylglycinamide formyltransferase-1
LERAKSAGIETYVIQSKEKEEVDEELFIKLQKYNVNLIVLAGYLKMIGPKLIEKYTIINTHPSLLPKYGGFGMYGMKVHTAVIENKEKQSGVTLHYVNERYDEGDIIRQSFVNVEEADTPETLAKKVQDVEKKQLIEELIRFSKGA